MLKILNLWTFARKLQENNERKKHPFTLDALNWRGLKLNSNILVRNYCFLKNNVTSEGAHKVSYYQQLSIARYKVSFYAENYFE